MSNLYRIFPVLWNDGICKQAATVYAIDRTSPVIPTSCSHYVKEDPAYYWGDGSGNFQRLLPQAPAGGCYQPPALAAVTWNTLPAWMSYVQTLGYTITSDLTKLKPYSDLYISGP